MTPEHKALVERLRVQVQNPTANIRLSGGDVISLIACPCPLLDEAAAAIEALTAELEECEQHFFEATAALEAAEAEADDSTAYLACENERLKAEIERLGNMLQSKTMVITP